MKPDLRKLERIGLPVLLGAILVGYGVLMFLSEGTHGGADDIGHYRRARYAFQFPSFFLYHWGKPLFTALSSPFAQFGFNGIRMFNVLCGTATVYVTYRTAKLLQIRLPLAALFLVLSSPLYVVLMLSGMTEILAGLVLALSIFLFFRSRYIGSAVLLSFLPFVRNEAVVILPLFLAGFALVRQWKAMPFLLAGFVFYSVAGSFHYDDLLWVIHEMPYKGNAAGIYGSGELLHYAREARYIFGMPLAVLIFAGFALWALEPFLHRSDKFQPRKEWLLRMLVAFLPFAVYFAAHSYVWWKGMGNSVGMSRVMVAVVPSAALLGAYAWDHLLALIPGRIPGREFLKHGLTVLLGAFLLTVPFRIYRIPVPLVGEQVIVKRASDWYTDSPYRDVRIYYYNPFFTHFLNINPYDEERSHQFVHDREHPERNIEPGTLLFWDAHFSPNEGRLPLERLMDNPWFRLIHLERDKKPFTVLGGYEYEIYVFERLAEAEAPDNRALYGQYLAEILEAD